MKSFAVKADSSGYISEIDARAIGEGICAAGGGRVKASDKIDPHVGFESVLTRGDRVKKGDVIGVLHCRRKTECERIDCNRCLGFIRGFQTGRFVKRRRFIGVSGRRFR